MEGTAFARSARQAARSRPFENKEAFMKTKLPYIVLMLLLSTLSVWAKNPCFCDPIPESKTYQGEARKKHIIGYTINWSCKYTCLPASPQRPPRLL
jgi:hypothetical protein